MTDITDYPNLTQDQINSSTEFFQKIDTQSTGQVTIQQIIDACLQFSYQFRPTANLYWFTSLQNKNDLLDNSEITEALYDEYKTTFPELNALFSDIDTETTGTITFLQLKTYYINLEQSRLDAQYVPTYTSQDFINLIKTEKNLTDDSSITLQQMLSYENEFNITRCWPL
jgi:Ca2+-binding EF-hand superfamily protein